MVKTQFEVPREQKTVIELTCRAIEDRHLMKFYYESKSGNKGERILRPYMIIPRGEILELVGLPVTELSKPINNRQAGHYTISQLKARLDSEQFEVLPKIFDNPAVPREIVVITLIPPLCRFIYDDENPKKVKAGWLKIKYV